MRTAPPDPDERPYGQRVHDGLDEACARLLTMGDQPVSGGTPVGDGLTIGLQELLTQGRVGRNQRRLHADL